jgi:hypothetical protein
MKLIGMIFRTNTNVVGMILIIIAAIITPARAGQRDPFPLGYSMMSQGAIIAADGAGGRQPWVSAAFYRDTLRWGASAAAVSYHGGGSAAQYAAGGFGAFGPVVAKASVVQLDAMGIYYEQTAAISAGSSWRFLSFGIDAQIYRIGLYGRPSDTRASANLGAELLVQTSRISADLAASGLAVSSGGGPGADPPFTLAARICTARNRYGSQGAMIKITPDDEAPVRFAIAQEYRIGKAFAISASIASNPTTVGFGITVDNLIDKSAMNGSAAVVNHPFLGWSKGVSVDYGR